MKILVTGNLGYIGPSVILQLRRSYPLAQLVGMDLGFFAHCLTGVNASPERVLDHQIHKDVRDVEQDDLKGFDTVIHLAAVSNDPMGKEFAVVTDEINCKSSIKMATLAKSAKVKNYVFASSCSVYGKYGKKSRTEKSKTQPLTGYAKSKIIIENYLKKKTSKEFKSICLRFATACGASPNIRLDLVLNDFVFRALTEKKIKLNSSGNAWRPLIDVKDMSKAIIYSIINIEKIKNILIVNVGSNNSNFKIIDLAKKVKKIIKNTTIELNSKINDQRSYKVDFTAYNNFIKKQFKHMTIEQTIYELIKNVKLLKKSKKNILFNKYVRLKVLEEKIKIGKLTKNLKWK